MQYKKSRIKSEMKIYKFYRNSSPWHQNGYPIPKTNMKSFPKSYFLLAKIHFELVESDGSRSLIPISSLSVTKLKSKRNPVPVPTAMSFMNLLNLNVAPGREESSLNVHMFPASRNNAPSRIQNNLNLYSALASSLISAV